MVKSVLNEGALAMSNVEEKHVTEGSINEKVLWYRELQQGF